MGGNEFHQLKSAWGLEDWRYWCTELRLEDGPRILQNEMEKSLECATLVPAVELIFVWVRGIARIQTWVMLGQFWSAVLHFMEPKVWTAKSRVKALSNPTSVERNDKNIRDNQGKVSSISRNISGKIREFCLEIAVAALYIAVSLFDFMLRKQGRYEVTLFGEMYIEI